MNRLITPLLLFGLGTLAGCSPGQPPSRPVPPVPSESETFKALHPRAIMSVVEAAAANRIVSQGPVATGFEGKGDSVTAGAGQWHDSARFMIHATDESVEAFRHALRDELHRAVELSGAQLIVPDGPANDSDNDLMHLECEYIHGKHNGKILARIEPAPEDAHELVPGGEEATHQLSIEVAETFQSDGR